MPHRSVDARLIVVAPPPIYEVTLPYQTFPSSGGALHNLFDYLIGKNRKTGEEETSHLASSWSMDPDGRAWTFTLKENIPFYLDGKASDDYIFNSEDVKHTWLLQSGNLSDKAFNTYTGGSPLKGVDDVVIDGNVITWNLNAINPDLSEYLSEDWTFGIISKQYWDDVGGEEGYEVDPIGTGAFSLIFHEVGNGILLERNADHYRHEPHFAELEFRWVVQPATVAAMLIAGEVHISQIPTLDSYLQDLLEGRSLKIAKSTLPSFHLVGVIPWYLPEAIDGTPTPNYDASAPTRDKRVREALNVSIDRNLINDVFFGGEEIPSAVPHLAEWWNFFGDESTAISGSTGDWSYPYDLQLAEQLLSEAGYPDGFDLTLYTPYDFRDMPEIVDLGEVVAEMWEEIGINVHLMPTEHGVVSQLQTERALTGDIYLTRRSLGLPSPALESMWRKSTTPSYEYPFITDWKENYDTVADHMERERLAKNLDDFWREEHLSIPLLWVFGKAAFNPTVVEGYEVRHGNFGPVRYHEYTLPASREA